MYWHGAQEDTRCTSNKINADRAMGSILVVTGIRSSTCPLEDLKPTLDSITLNDMQFGPGEELFIDVKGIQMPVPGQTWSTKAFLDDGSECEPTGDEAFIKRVQVLPRRVMCEEKSDPTEGVDVLSYSEIDLVVAYMRMSMHDRVAAPREHAQAKSPHWWDDRELMTRRFEKVDSVARVIDHSADKDDAPLGSDPPTWGSPRVGEKFDQFQTVAEIFEHYRWERPPTSLNRAYRTGRCQTWIQKRHTPP